MNAENAVLKITGLRAWYGKSQVLHGVDCVVGAGEAESQAALLLAETLRDAYPECRVTCICGGGSMKSQMKRADRTGAQIALILGSEELASDTITLKPLRGQGEQQRVARAALLATLSTAPVN